MSSSLVGITIGLIFNDLLPADWHVPLAVGATGLALVLQRWRRLKALPPGLFWSGVALFTIPAPVPQGDIVPVFRASTPPKHPTTPQLVRIKKSRYGRYGWYAVATSGKTHVTFSLDGPLKKGSTLLYSADLKKSLPLLVRREHRSPQPPSLLGAMTRGQPPEPRGALLLRELGLSHLIAISGLHIGVVLLLVFWLLRLLRLLLYPLLHLEQEGLLLFLGLPLVWWYWHWSGGSVSTTRAALMASLYLLVVRRLGLGSAMGALCFAFLLLAAGEPHFLYNPGLQLSFAAILGLWTFSRFGRDLLTRGLLASLGATLFTSLVGYLYFGELYPHAVLANLLFLPLFTLLLLPLGIVAQVLFSPVGVTWPLFLADWLLSHLLSLMELLLHALPHRSGGGDLFVALLLWGSLFLFALGPSLRRAGVLAVAVLLLFLPLFPERQFPQIHFFSQGERDATLMLLPQGKRVLVDMGVPGSVRWFVRNRVFAIDALYLSHMHRDHYEAIEELLSFVTVKVLYHNGGPLPRALQRVCATISCARAPARLTLGETEILLLSGQYRGRSRSTGLFGENNNSLVLLVRSRGHRFLFLGDLEGLGAQALLSRYAAPTPVTLLKVSHHGHKNGTSRQLLERFPARYGFIPGQKADPQVLELLKEFGVRLLPKNGRVTTFLP